MMHLRGLVVCLFLSVVLESPIHAGDRLTHFVTDQTNTLSKDELALLERRLSEFEAASSTQLVVVVVPTIESGSVEEAALRIAEENGIGRKDKNNGALLFIAKDDRQLRIEAGYGLEGVLTDAISGQIIRYEIVPRFKQGKFFEGINAGVDAIIAVTKNEYKADSSERRSGKESLLPFIVMMVIIFFVSSRFRRKGFLGGAMPPIFFPGGSGRSFGGWRGGGGFSGGGGSFGGGGASGRCS